MANQEEKKDNAFVGFFKKAGTSTKSWFKEKGLAIKEWGHNSKEATKAWWERLRGRTFKENMKAFGRVCYNNKGWLWILPAFILLCIFTFYPIVNTIKLAFMNEYNGLSMKYNGIGFENFKIVVQNSYFKTALLNTILFAFISVPVSTILALLISIALASIKPLQKLYQSIFFLPYLTNALAIGSVFAVMFGVVRGAGGTSWGLINNIFGTHIDWVNSISQGTNASMRFVIILYEVWAGLPFKILILFGALQNVNKQYYDAAKIDGANKRTTVLRITVPLISPMISYLVITGFIGGFKTYSSVVGIMGEKMGLDYEMGTIVGLIYRFMGTNNGTGIPAAYGVASAAALILFALIMVFTFINMQLSKKRVHY